MQDSRFFGYPEGLKHFLGPEGLRSPDLLVGVFNNCKNSWLALGPKLAVIDNSDCSLRTTWTFGLDSKNTPAKIACVKELADADSRHPYLIVGVNYLAGGMFCVYHPFSTLVLRAVKVNVEIGDIAVVDSGATDDSPLPFVLNSLQGSLAIGGLDGSVTFTDLSRTLIERVMQGDFDVVRNEKNPSSLVYINCMDDTPAKLKHKKNLCAMRDHSLAILLNDGKNGLIIPEPESEVTAMYFVDEAAVLLVGYSVGVWQMWDVTGFTLLYTSDRTRDTLAVESFSILEPCDDPRVALYCWVGHQSRPPDHPPIAVLYSMAFKTKDMVKDGSTVLYQEFIQCCRTFDIELTFKSKSAGRLVSTSAISRSFSRTLQHSIDYPETETTPLRIFTTVWDAWCEDSENQVSVLSIFDLNQWYKDQMPEKGREGAPYLLTLRLRGSPLAAAAFPTSSFSIHTSVQPLEQHFYPSALTFKCVVLESIGLTRGECHGLQTDWLNTVRESGASTLHRPTPLFRACLRASLAPTYWDPPDPETTSQEEERSYVLAVCLENQLRDVILDCAKAWCDGSRSVGGCTLTYLLEWLWGTLSIYKKTVDGLCITLFDRSGSDFDVTSRRRLQHCRIMINTISFLYSRIVQDFSIFIMLDDVGQKAQAMKLILLYVDTVSWFTSVKILPERNSRGEPSSTVPYQYEKLLAFCTERREALKDAVFLIDGVCQGCKGLLVYPPNTLQSLMRATLMVRLPSKTKYFVLLYFLLDLVDQLSYESYSSTIENILKFRLVFGITESLSKIVQAFWYLDHSYFDDGVKCLLDRRVLVYDMTEWQHRAVLRLLLSQSKPKLALAYLQGKRPPLTLPDDVRFEMSLLLANSLIPQAFMFQRRHKALQETLIKQFFTGCMENRTLKKVCHLPLDKNEEKAFFNFLTSKQFRHSGNLQVIYLLTRSRYLEAIDLHEKLSSRTKHSGDQSSIRNRIVRGITSNVNDVSRHLTPVDPSQNRLYGLVNTRLEPLSVRLKTKKDSFGVTNFRDTKRDVAGWASSYSGHLWQSLTSKMQKHEDTDHPEPRGKRPHKEEVELGTKRARMSPSAVAVGRGETTPERKPKNVEVLEESSRVEELTRTPIVEVLREEKKLLRSPLVSRHPHSILKSRSEPRRKESPYLLRSRAGAATPASTEQTPSKTLRFALPSKDGSPEDKESEDKSPISSKLLGVSGRRSIHKLDAGSTSEELWRKRSPVMMRNRLSFEEAKHDTNKDVSPVKSKSDSVLGDISKASQAEKQEEMIVEEVHSKEEEGGNDTSVEEIDWKSETPENVSFVEEVLEAKGPEEDWEEGQGEEEEVKVENIEIKEVRREKVVYEIVHLEENEAEEGENLAETTLLMKEAVEHTSEELGQVEPEEEKKTGLSLVLGEVYTLKDDMAQFAVDEELCYDEYDVEEDIYADLEETSKKKEESKEEDEDSDVICLDSEEENPAEEANYKEESEVDSEEEYCKSNRSFFHDKFRAEAETSSPEEDEDEDDEEDVEEEEDIEEEEEAEEDEAIGEEEEEVDDDESFLETEEREAMRIIKLAKEELESIKKGMIEAKEKPVTLVSSGETEGVEEQLTKEMETAGDTKEELKVGEESTQVVKSVEETTELVQEELETIEPAQVETDTIQQSKEQLNITDDIKEELNTAKCTKEELLLLEHSKDSATSEHKKGELMTIEHAKEELMTIEHANEELMPVEHTKEELMPVEHAKEELMPIEHSKEELNIAEHAEEELKTVEHAEEDLKIAEHTEVELNTADHAGEEFKIAEYAEKELKIAEHKEEELNTAEHPDEELKTAEHVVEELNTVEHTEEELNTVEHAEEELKTAEHAEEESKTAKHAEEELKTAEHAEEESKTAKHAEEELKIAGHAEKELKTVEQEEEDLKTAEHTEVELNTAEDAGEVLKTAEHVVKELKIAEHAEEELKTAEHAEEELKSAEHAEEELKTAEHAEEELKIAEHAEKELKSAEEELKTAEHAEKELKSAEEELKSAEHAEEELKTVEYAQEKKNRMGQVQAEVKIVEHAKEEVELMEITEELSGTTENAKEVLEPSKHAKEVTEEEMLKASQSTKEELKCEEEQIHTVEEGEQNSQETEHVIETVVEKEKEKSESINESAKEVVETKRQATEEVKIKTDSVGKVKEETETVEQVEEDLQLQLEFEETEKEIFSTVGGTKNSEEKEAESAIFEDCELEESKFESSAIEYSDRSCNMGMIISEESNQSSIGNEIEQMGTPKQDAIKEGRVLRSGHKSRPEDPSRKNRTSVEGDKESTAKGKKDSGTGTHEEVVPAEESKTVDRSVMTVKSWLRGILKNSVAVGGKKDTTASDDGEVGSVEEAKTVDRSVMTVKTRLRGNLKNCDPGPEKSIRAEGSGIQKRESVGRHDVAVGGDSPEEEKARPKGILKRSSSKGPEVFEKMEEKVSRGTITEKRGLDRTVVEEEPVPELEPDFRDKDPRTHRGSKRRASSVQPEYTRRAKRKSSSDRDLRRSEKWKKREKERSSSDEGSSTEVDHTEWSPEESRKRHRRRFKAVEEETRSRGREDGVRRKSSSVEDVRRKSSSVDDVRRKRFSVEELRRKKRSSAEDLRSKSSSVEDMRRKSSSVEDLRRRRSSAEDVRRRRSSVEDVRRKRSSDEDQRRRRSSVEEVSRSELHRMHPVRDRFSPEETRRCKSEEPEEKWERECGGTEPRPGAKRTRSLTGVPVGKKSSFRPNLGAIYEIPEVVADERPKIKAVEKSSVVLKKRSEEVNDLSGAKPLRRSSEGRRPELRRKWFPWGKWSAPPVLMEMVSSSDESTAPEAVSKVRVEADGHSSESSGVVLRSGKTLEETPPVRKPRRMSRGDSGSEISTPTTPSVRPVDESGADRHSLEEYSKARRLTRSQRQAVERSLSGVTAAAASPLAGPSGRRLRPSVSPSTEEEEAGTADNASVYSDNSGVVLRSGKTLEETPVKRKGRRSLAASKGETSSNESSQADDLTPRRQLRNRRQQ